MTAASFSVVVRARRWMLAGLVVSIVGTRLIDGGSTGAVAEGLLPLVWLAVLATVGHVLGFAAPLFARAASRFDPAGVLVASDLLEAVASLVALTLLILLPRRFEAAVFGCYLVLAAVFPAVLDVVEELYAHRLAQLDEHQALSFNASVYSLLSLVGLVAGMPVGSWLASRSIVELVAANLLLSTVGCAFRLVSSRTLPVGAAVHRALDAGEFDQTGSRMEVREFLSDLFATGLVSPGLDMLLKAGATISGLYVYLWLAALMPLAPGASLAVLLAAFGIGATTGPHVAPLLRRRMPPQAALLIVYLLTFALVVVMVASAGWITTRRLWQAGIAYVLLVGVVSRARSVLTVTYRQTSSTGGRFVRLMSWSLSLAAVGAVVGNWLGVLLDVPHNPRIGLTVLAVVQLPAIALAARATGTSRTREGRR